MPQLSARRRVVSIVTIVVVLAIIGVVLYFTRSNAASTAVGDCVAQTGSNSISKVACDDPKATFKVVGRVEDKTQIESSISACKDFQGAESSYWEGEFGKKGLVLCLAKITK